MNQGGGFYSVKEMEGSGWREIQDMRTLGDLWQGVRGNGVPSSWL